MTLVDRLPQLLSREPNIRLIIIDSLAALFRSEDIMFEHHTKANTLQYFGFAMHTLCQRYNLAIVCVNQVYRFDIIVPSSDIPSSLVGANSVQSNDEPFSVIPTDGIGSSVRFNLGISRSLPYPID